MRGNFMHHKTTRLSLVPLKLVYVLVMLEINS